MWRLSQTMAECQCLAQVNEALGLHTRPSKPLLWKLGGHCKLPPSQHLYSLACRLQQLCMAASPASADDPAALIPVKQLLLSARSGTADNQHADAALSNGGMEREQTSSEGVSDETAVTVAANLAADVELRQALQEGSALFQLVVSQAALQPGSLPALGRLGGGAADPAAAAASIVDSLQSEIMGRALRVRSLLSALSGIDMPGTEKQNCVPYIVPLPSFRFLMICLSPQGLTICHTLVKHTDGKSLLQLGRD